MVAVAVGLDQPASPPAPPGLLGRLERTASPRARVLLVALNLAAVAFYLLSVTWHGIGFGRYRIDLDVYRIGSQVWLRHGELYGVLPLTSSGMRLPFSYPPIAAASHRDGSSACWRNAARNRAAAASRPVAARANIRCGGSSR